MAKQQSERTKKYEHRNLELEGDLKAVRSEIEHAMQDREAMLERLARHEAVNTELTNNANRLERDLLSARSEVARCQSDAQYHKEKCERLEESLECAGKRNKLTSPGMNSKGSMQICSAVYRPPPQNVRGWKVKSDKQK